ncbi:MAG: hypothetical protein Q4B36_02430 [Tissierellia bacterium]|nr:hypothetical protein [Tissierellia bacterium]
MSDFSNATQKRIFNTIWNLADKYDFFPPFTGYDLRGNPDFYFNMIIGLSVKYYGKENINSLFDFWKGSAKQETYDFLTWMALEDLLFRKEVKKRPVLNDLRKVYAKNFLMDRNDLFRRKLALHNVLVFNVQTQRMKDILNIKKNPLKGRDRKIYDSLIFKEDIEFIDFKNSLVDTYKKFLKFKPDKKPNKASNIIRKSFSKVNFYPLERSTKPSYVFSENKSENKSSFYSFIYSISNRNSLKEEQKIEKLFGKSMLPKNEYLDTIDKYCTDSHKKSRLWFTKFNYDSKKISDDNAEKLAIEQNKKKFQENRLNYNKQIRELSRKINSSLISNTQSYDLISDHGNLIGNIAWKSKLPNENHIFSIKSTREVSSMSIDLLIDGSASLLSYQQDLAIQAYILARSLEICNIPIRITTYCSVNNYTILTILKDFDESPSKDKIFSYHAQGWNRDGLAFRGFQKLLEKRQRRNHLLLIMSDASPSDIKPLYTKTFTINKSYDGKDALLDSKKELDAIRKQRINIAAIINSNNSDKDNETIKNATFLYKNRFAKIDSALNFSNAASRLIKNEIRRTEKNNYL